MTIICAGSKPARSTAMTSGTYPSSLSSTSSRIRPAQARSTSASSGGLTPAAASISSRVRPLTGAPPHRGVVEGDQLAVAGPADIELDHVGADVDRVREGRDGVLGGPGRDPPVRGDHGVAHEPKYALVR